MNTLEAVTHARKLNKRLDKQEQEVIEEERSKKTARQTKQSSWWPKSRHQLNVDDMSMTRGSFEQSSGFNQTSTNFRPAGFDLTAGEQFIDENVEPEPTQARQSYKKLPRSSSQAFDLKKLPQIIKNCRQQNQRSQGKQLEYGSALSKRNEMAEPNRTSVGLVKRFVNTIHFLDIAQQQQSDRETQDKTYMILKRANIPPIHKHFKIPTKTRRSMLDLHENPKKRMQKTMTVLNLKDQIDVETEKVESMLSRPSKNRSSNISQSTISLPVSLQKVAQSSRIATADVDQSLAEKMITITREARQNFHLRSHKQEVKDQILLEAKKKLHALQSQLLKVEGQRVKNVNDMLAINELIQKIQKANKLIERLTFSELGTVRQNAGEMMQTLNNEVAIKPEHVRFLRNMTQTSLTKLQGTAQPLLELKGNIGIKKLSSLERFRQIH